jgi:HEAT repeat protein
MRSVEAMYGKKIITASVCFLLAISLCSAEDNKIDMSKYEVSNSTIPTAKRPKKPDSEQLANSAAGSESNNTDEYVTRCNDTFYYGLETEIGDLIDELTKNEDMRFVDQIYDLFQVTKAPGVQQKILTYFTKLKDPCLEDFAVTVINDPYEQKKETVSDCFKYVAAVNCKEAIPGVVTLVDKDDEDYFDSALSCLGDIGGPDEALYLTQYLDRDDLSTAQKQSLMKVLGKIKAVETWDKLSEIAQNEDENSFVRMYAAEAIGAMEKPESEPILIKLFAEDDPNFRVYVIKGISHYHDKDADDIIIQALRDSQYKVRLEAVNSVEERNMVQTVPYLVYRCKDKTEQASVKDKCYKVIAKLNTQEGNEYLVSLITDKKTGDTSKSKVAAALLENNFAGTSEIISLAESCIKDDTRKNLRYALGKEFAKYGRPEYEKICEEFIDSKDVSTQGTGLDIFAKGRYATVRPKVEALAKDAIDEEAEKNAAKTDDKTAGDKTAAADKKAATAKKKPANVNAKKAKRILEQIDSLYGNQDSATAAEQTAPAAPQTAPEK